MDAAINGYGENCRKLYGALTPVRSALDFARRFSAAASNTAVTRRPHGGGVTLSTGRRGRRGKAGGARGGGDGDGDSDGAGDDDDDEGEGDVADDDSEDEAAAPPKPRVYVVSGGSQDELRDVFAHHGIAAVFCEVCGSPTTKPEHVRRILEKERVDPSK